MSKVTTKRQVSIPKEIADRYRIEAGDEIQWIPAGSEIRVLPPGASRSPRLDAAARLALFDRATERRNARARPDESTPPPDRDRGWSREELHRRAGAR